MRGSDYTLVGNVLRAQRLRTEADESPPIVKSAKQKNFLELVDAFADAFAKESTKFDRQMFYERIFRPDKTEETNGETNGPQSNDS